MFSFRFETYENVIAKHTLSKVSWTQAAQWAFNHNLNRANWAVVNVRQLDDDTVEIIKRKDQNKSICYKMGWAQEGWFERVIINRKDNTVAVDRMDVHWLEDKPFIGQRDLFMPSKRADGSVDFIRHAFWVHKLGKMCVVMGSHFNAFCYKRGFRSQEDIKQRQ